MTLISAVRDALQSATTDEDLAQLLLSDQILTATLESASMTEAEVNEALGYAEGTLRALSRRSKAFPAPVLVGKRWRTTEIQQYRETHGRKA